MTSYPKAVLSAIQEKYEQTRMDVIEKPSVRTRPEGFAVVVRNGLLAWTKVTMEGLIARNRLDTAEREKSTPWISEVETVVTNILLKRLEA